MGSVLFRPVRLPCHGLPVALCTSSKMSLVLEVHFYHRCYLLSHSLKRAQSLMIINLVATHFMDVFCSAWSWPYLVWGISKVHSNYEYCLFYQNLLLNSVTHTVWRLRQTSHAHLIFFFCTNKPSCICKILKVPRCNFCLRELMNRNCGFYILDPITQLMHLKGLSFFCN